jgi:hypothetical protein
MPALIFQDITFSILQGDNKIQQARKKKSLNIEGH